MKRLPLILALLLLTSLPALGQDDARRYQGAFDRVDALVHATMRASKVPGMSLALTDRDHLLRATTYGYANNDRREPVTRDTLFGIGSIGKSFTAVACLELRDAHKLDVKEPIATYLPWFKPNSTVPISLHYVLTHTAGFPNMRMELMSSLYQAYWLTQDPVQLEPGKLYHYSSAGYDLASIVIDQLAHEPYGQFIREKIFDPLGMQDSEPVFRNAMRPRLAISYESLYDDRPAHADDPLVQSNWYEYGGGAGSIASTPEDLAIYLRMLLSRGMGPRERLLSEESFRLLTQHAVDRGSNRYYGYGIESSGQDGHSLIGHAGGVQGFRSMMLGDLDDGLGVVIFSNSSARLDDIAQFALKVLRAALHNQALPPAPAEEQVTSVPDAADYVGTYKNAAGGSFTLQAEDGKLMMAYQGQSVALERFGKDAFVCDHPDFALFPLRFGRQNDTVVEAFYGGDWYTQNRYRGPREFDYPAEWNAYPGHYRTATRQHVNFRIVLRKGKIWVIDAAGAEMPVSPAHDGFFQVADTPEWLRFDTLLNGRTLRVNYSGTDFHRDFTP